ncbi:hypothetical protein [Coleofasciculus sp. FACHB-SPT9]|uniref:hypothetical protein n=1 Tax=Cyanophyceae TaxID=3028117 RepID=UPI0016876DE0|nr:hypothetical protein [Coleofasciculus sp. FACHB-SPT9]MBD1890488.1 hypothetical protein [Coleofasciculus sp. FACHB-SPT9]
MTALQTAKKAKSLPLFELACWLCGCQESVIVPAIAPTLKASVRCATCDCFLGAVGGEK